VVTNTLKITRATMLLWATSNGVGVNVRLVGYGLSVSRYQGIYTHTNIEIKMTCARNVLSAPPLHCENIHSWISPSVDLVFSQQDGNYDFKFPKRFLEILPEISLFSQLFYSFTKLKHLKAQPLVSMPFPFAFALLNAIQAVRHSHSLSDPVLCQVTQAKLTAF
jgi:hypothetical protein